MKHFFLIILTFLFVSGALAYQETIPPTGGLFPVTAELNTNEPITDFIQKLHDKKVIRSVYVFKILLVTTKADTRLKPNVYTFTEPQNMLKVLYHIIENSENNQGVKVVIPEGSTNQDIVRIVQNVYPELNLESIAQAPEGYFFPDTYFFSSDATLLQIKNILENNFLKKTNSLFLTKNGEQVHRIVTMASILEKEGKNKEEREIIAGILYKRMKLGMPLQVDATFLYTLGKGSNELTLNDLKLDSPYNTYTRQGLPFGPINNPGLETIQAAMYPVDSEYLYYLHDSTGQIHYGKTFEDHKKNKNKYLK